MKRFAAALVALLFAAPALAGGEAAGLFAARCASCHGADGKGSKMGEKMGVPDLTKVKASEKDLEKVIADGKGKMMAYRGKLTDGQIHELAEYVQKGLR
jgi:mono/diheme cytochrome c family protein